MDRQAITNHGFRKKRKEFFPISIIKENGPSFITPGGNMVKGACIFDPERSSH
jgi:hypothetical protein